MIDFEQFNEKAALLAEKLTTPAKVKTAYTEGLRYRLYEPEKAAHDLFIVYHGGGVNIDAGYDLLARQLTIEDHFAVCLVDIRGHGDSIGRKGAVSQTAIVWRDVDRVIAELKTQFPAIRLHLLGHSSGAGMLINYFTRHKPAHKIDSLVLLAPELGQFATGIHRNDSPIRFAEVSQWPFIINAISGGLFFGHYPAVKLNFPEDLRARYPDFLQHYTVNMSNALTPRQPAKQLAALPLPTLLLAAEEDELFDPVAMSKFASEHGNKLLHFKMLHQSTHLDCLFRTQEALRQHLETLQ
ncbi:2-succinyl-6-hydroxy-2,4-cyclohexadiene-1-carboxylate synthase [Xenorhabdus mauleonii]|uniref:2-succinyl-6-hydroxy-2, 4-cyclohexadiene-1-carboxylate synthase n=1 Tax=Xenorhabdus mauleonii TaxID=351675 RepID=A0A1I3IES2_9GAMM|nr:alpha/beta fold hydrolase [Xenorhabdus mauleonii]PHM39470.1 2-succinyl-6-hydroxy-2,4-cyclohexadiene-1-carboxylate synthase [Xenorhabdus mauleonii]SFI46422.1 Lysophospholipase, alpha-beta hydrolase superfamily [Xenorhabdus mauleonii]